MFMQELILCCIIWLEEKVGGEEVTLAFLEPAESTYAISLKRFLPDSGVAIRAGWCSGLFPGFGSAQKGSHPGQLWK